MMTLADSNRDDQSISVPEHTYFVPV